MKYLLIILLTFSTLTTIKAQEYQQDILGGEFEQLTITHPATYDGDVVSTLVRLPATEPTRRAVLYVHGYNDYFFQVEMAEQFIEHGWQFYAVDLRRYGRSLREWQDMYSFREMSEYFADIDTAIDQIQSEGMEEIILVGHSTGGLLTSLYCDHNRDHLRVDAMILNSPFFDMNLGWAIETLAQPVIALVGKYFSDWVILDEGDKISSYAKSIHSDWHGEWSYDQNLKTSRSKPITAGWISSISAAHDTLQRGLNIPCPTLVLYSDKSVKGSYTPQHQSSDSVLDVADISYYANKIGNHVTKHEVKDGMHDLILSRPEVRYPLYDYIFNWLEEL